MNILKSEGRISAKRITALAALVILAAVVCLLPQIVSTSARLGTEILMFVVLAVAWTMFSGPTGYISLAPAAFFGMGIYMAALFSESLAEVFSASPSLFIQNLWLPILMVAGGVVAFVVALGIGAITLRLRGVYFTIFTFSLVELLHQLILFLESKITGRRGRFIESIQAADPSKRADVVYYYIAGLAVLLLIVAFVIKRSRFGKALVSIGESEDAAAHIGINTTRVKLVAFSVSSFFMGAVGAAYAARLGYVDPLIAFNADYSFTPILMVIFGGMGSLAGPVIGAAVFAYLQEIARVNFSSYYMILIGLVMIIAILFLPNGIFGAGKQFFNWIKRTGKGEASRADTEG